MTAQTATTEAPIAKPLRAEERELERFQRDTAYHEMTILHDHGLYRHLRFRHVDSYTIAGRKPRAASHYWFDLITWPGSLAIHSDCGAFTFSRIEDMFGFFRGSRINPTYWAEKVQAQDKHKGVSVYSQDHFRQQVMEEVAPDDDGNGPEKDWPGLTVAIERDIFSRAALWSTDHEHGARQALHEFEFGVTWTGTCPRCGEEPGLADEDEARRWRITHTGHGRGVDTGRVDGFSFWDSWEWDLHDWDWQYLWCLHAIQWGIAAYDAERKRLAAEGC